MKFSQKQVWNNIAEEQYKFKTNPAEHTLSFLKRQRGKILDFGSGAGRNLINLKLNKNSDIYLVDFSIEMIKLAKKRTKKLGLEKNTNFFVADLTKLPFEDNFFDSAIATAVFHCIEKEKNREKAARELYRVLKKGAEAEITVWNKNSKRFKNSVKEKYITWRNKGKRYYYLFDEKEIHNLFKSVGFKIKKRYEPERNIIFIAEKPEK